MFKKFIFIFLVSFSTLAFAGEYENGYREGYRDGFKEGAATCGGGGGATLYRCTLTPMDPTYYPTQSGWHESEVSAKNEARAMCVRAHCTAPQCGICLFARTECETRP